MLERHRIVILEGFGDGFCGTSTIQYLGTFRIQRVIRTIFVHEVVFHVVLVIVLEIGRETHRIMLNIEVIWSHLGTLFELRTRVYPFQHCAIVLGYELPLRTVNDKCTVELNVEYWLCQDDLR